MASKSKYFLSDKDLEELLNASNSDLEISEDDDDVENPQKPPSHRPPNFFNHVMEENEEIIFDDKESEVTMNEDNVYEFVDQFSKYQITEKKT